MAAAKLPTVDARVLYMGNWPLTLMRADKTVSLPRKHTARIRPDPVAGPPTRLAAGRLTGAEPRSIHLRRGGLHRALRSLPGYLTL